MGAVLNSPVRTEEITLNVFVHANHPFDRVKPIYEAKYPNVKLNMMEQNDVAVFRATLAANGEGTPDLLWPEIDMVQELGKTGVLLDVTELVKKHEADLAPGKLAECFIASTGKYAAFPGDIATVGVYYRQDLLDQAGVTIPTPGPGTFITIGQQVKEATGASSLAYPTTGTRDTAQLWSYVLCQLRGRITNAEGTEVTLDDDKGIAAMEIAQKSLPSRYRYRRSAARRELFRRDCGRQRGDGHPGRLVPRIRDRAVREGRAKRTRSMAGGAASLGW